MGNHELVEEAESKLFIHERRREMRRMLEEALESDDIDKLKKAISIAKQNKKD